MAEKKPQKPKIKLPAGTAIYPHLTAPDYGTEKFKKPEGEYNVRVRMLASDATEQMALLDKHADESYAKALADNGGKKFAVEKGKKKELIRNSPYTLCVDDAGEPTGMVEFKAKMKASYKDKQGVVQYNKPNLFNHDGTPFTGPDIWGGSVVWVAGTIGTYGNLEIGYGATIYLAAVMVKTLVAKGSRSASEYGFETSGSEDDPASEGGDSGAAGTDPEDF